MIDGLREPDEPDFDSEWEVTPILDGSIPAHSETVTDYSPVLAICIALLSGLVLLFAQLPYLATSINATSLRARSLVS